MKVLEGKSVFSGIAIGKISILQKVDTSVKRVHVEDPEEEVKRVEAAREQAVAQLQKLYDKALQEVGESGAAIFEVHQMMLDDDDYLDSIHNIIRTESVNAEYAVATTGDNFSSMFAQMDDDYMKARAADVKDISDRLVRVLSGHGDGELEGWLSFAGKFFTMMSSKKKGGRYTESKKETWRHEKLSTKIQTKSLKKTLQQRLYFRA